MSDLEKLVLENKEQLKTIFIDAARAYAQEVGASEVFWYQTLDEERLYIEVVGPFLVIDQNLRMPRGLETIEMDSDQRTEFWRGVYEASKAIKERKILNLSKKGRYTPDIVIDVDVSKFKDIIKHSTSLGYAFGDSFVWVSETGYFESDYDLFCRRD